MQESSTQSFFSTGVPQHKPVLNLSEVERRSLCPLTTCEACVHNGVSLERKGWWSACASLDLTALECIIPQHSAAMPSIKDEPLRWHRGHCGEILPLLIPHFPRAVLTHYLSWDF